MTHCPPLPKSPGDWLTVFREQVECDDGRPLSPERLGDLIGYSGSTVRRWESDRYVPQAEAIAQIAQICRLSRLQTAFLYRSLGRVIPMPAPDPAEFREFSRRLLLSIDRPAILCDELLYQRAWNSHVDALAPGANRALARNAHTLALLFQAGLRPGVDPADREADLRHRLKLFWVRTAPLSYRPEYASLVTELEGIDGFRDAWLALAAPAASNEAVPLSYPQSLPNDIARFDVLEQGIVFPPLYVLQQYLPADTLASERLQALVAAGPPTVAFSDAVGWRQGDARL